MSHTLLPSKHISRVLSHFYNDALQQMLQDQNVLKGGSQRTDKLTA